MTEQSNARLEELLDSRADGHEPAPEAVLTALFEGGAFIPVTTDRKVIVLPDDEMPPTLLGFTGAEVGAELLPSAPAMLHCDVAQLRDILAQTGIARLAIRSRDGQALLPEQVLRDWADCGPGTEMEYGPSTDPTAIALRDAMARRIREFPAVRSVWVARVTAEGEHLMVHFAVDEDLPSGSADRLMQTVLREDVELGPGRPKVAMAALNTTTHADTIARLDRQGLDTVRHDAESGQVQVISHEHDDPMNTPAPPPNSPAGSGSRASRRPGGQQPPKNSGAPGNKQSNHRLAELLDSHADGHEPAPEALLAALVEGGAFIPVTDAWKVIFLPDDDQSPILIGFTSAEVGAERFPTAPAMLHCDEARLRDILEQTGVGKLKVYSGRWWASFPGQLLRDRAAYGPGAEFRLDWSTDPTAVALRQALVRRIREFPAVRSVWIAQVRWQTTGEEHLLLHISVDEDLPSGSADRLMQTLLHEEVEQGPKHPKIGMIALNTTTHADTIAQLDRQGLDTVRHDAESGQVQVVSREYDGPPADAPAPPRPPAKRRWFGRS
ncbi:hypothetical protein [Kitasatospora sp. NPDC059673]|uniref:hypothetical protein n=1 Tax=Kitasatospora sp. NPDC059673 TaxID=3346901 RepID=UPI0036C406E5